MNDTTWATKYRPRRFSEVKGQPEMLFLANLVARSEPYPPVMMFCGPSGVGKTTLARIFAAAANCQNRDKANPCGTCEVCVAIADGTHPGVVEMDAALYSGADDMRRVRDQAYTQAPGDLQVFIIDEVHSISGQAWNVLLKLFEEPPAGVCFLLLTSEPNKVPTKIRTRSMRLDFGRVAPKFVRARLEEVAEAEGVSPTPELVDSIVNVCDGSVRDAIMLLEQAHVIGEDASINLNSRDLSLEVIHAAMRKDHAEGMRLLYESVERTGDFKGILTLWGASMEKVLYYKYGIPSYVAPAKERLLKELANGMTETQWASGMETLSEWSHRVLSRAHLSFVWSQFVRALHGATTARSEAPTPKVEETATEAVDEMLSEFV